MRNTTRSLINALRLLDSEIQSDDGVANAVVAEAANRLEEQQERIKRLEEAGDPLCAAAAFMGWHLEIEKWNKAKEAKP